MGANSAEAFQQGGRDYPQLQRGTPRRHRPEESLRSKIETRIPSFHNKAHVAAADQLDRILQDERGDVFLESTVLNSIFLGPITLHATRQTIMELPSFGRGPLQNAYLFTYTPFASSSINKTSRLNPPASISLRELFHPLSEL